MATHKGYGQKLIEAEREFFADIEACLRRARALVGKVRPCAIQ